MGEKTLIVLFVIFITILSHIDFHINGNYFVLSFKDSDANTFSLQFFNYPSVSVHSTYTSPIN